ncbi:hypothetical protein [Devosia sp.]|uniref:hypothetical protein n=1 Tax=Devosia sp. TaxID=1871048 RepID=UPI0032644581
MIVNKSMFPLQTGFSIISKMQQSMATLQQQLGTGQKASNLAEMGRDLPMSLSVRSRLSKIEGYSANIDTVNLRLSFMDKTMSRFDQIEGEARNAAIQGQYGTNNINMATLPDLSKARFDEVVTMLNSDVAGRYLFGGSKTDQQPLPDTGTLLDGAGAGIAGFKTVVNERKLADAGTDGRGRLQTSYTAPTGVVNLTEDGVHPFGFKLSNMSGTYTAGSVTLNQKAPGTLPAGNTESVKFEPTPVAQISSGQTITLGFSLPDGGTTDITLRAVTAAEASGAKDEFVIGADADATAANFKTTLDARLLDVGSSTLAASSTFAAAKNFFNAPGEPVLRVSGSPATATSLKVATEADTVMWYKGQSPAIAADGLGRTNISTATDTVTLARTQPVTPDYGFKALSLSASTANITTDSTNPDNVTVKFAALPSAGETVQVNLTQPDGSTRSFSLKAVAGPAGPGEFTIGSGATPVDAINNTAAAFSAALKNGMSTASAAAEGNPRQSVTAQIDDSSKASYGMEANESGLLRMVRTLASLSVETYPNGDDPGTRVRFDEMAMRQQSEMSEAHNSERGSIEIMTMELSVAASAAQSATQRHTDYGAQLENLLSDTETVSKEETAVSILALQTRLQASYQVTSMVSKLSLVNFL